MSDETMVEEVEESTSTEQLPPGHRRITASVEVNGKKTEASFVFDFKETTVEAVEAYTEQIVYERYIRACAIEAQAKMRPLLKAGKSPQEVGDFMSETWFPGASSQNPEVTIVNKFAEMSPEERRRIVEELQSRIND